MQKQKHTCRSAKAAPPNKLLQKILFPLAGLAGLIWFIIRVVPKPSRANYPCMKAAVPVASAFVVWLTGVCSSAIAFKTAKTLFRKTRYAAGAVALLSAVLLLGVTTISHQRNAIADSAVEANKPMGEGKGIFPGRVVWAWNPDATNENCSNSYNQQDAYYLPKNSDIEIIDSMISDAILKLTGESTLTTAWDGMFKNFNNRRGRGLVGYQNGEQIFIKINLVGSSVNSTFRIADASNYSMSRTSPQPVLVILRHLVNVCGIDQALISVGDPMKDLSQDYFNVWYEEFPYVNYVSAKGGGGRETSKASARPIIYYSDRGTILREGDASYQDASAGDAIYNDKLYTCLENADYMINVPALKAHHRAGMTLVAKCHFGSHTRSAAKHLHMGLINPDGQPVSSPKRQGYNKYRVQVDLLGHEKLGGNTMLVVVDGLWGGPDANDPPVKFKMAPFNNDWPSSIFVSQDQIAVASVCLDFLREEFRDGRHEKTYPQMYGVDDYLRQAADPAEWPEDIQYDPENDGTVLGSLGTHEHWNNAADMLYSRNMGKDEGIEFLGVQQATVLVQEEARPLQNFALAQNYPNPFNGMTSIHYELAASAQIELVIYNALGKKITTLFSGTQTAGTHQAIWNGLDAQHRKVASGVYFYQLRVMDDTSPFQQTQKMVLAQ